MTVIFDCNIWITFTLNRQIDVFTNLFDSGVEIASCIHLKSELEDVLRRRKFHKLLTDEYVLKTLELHDLVTKTHKLGKLISITTDPKDDYLFALCSKSRADYLVTGDKLVLNVEKYKHTEIISLNRFKEIFR
jgi:putative PIN family toxin of toxin-antitoxin system